MPVYCTALGKALLAFSADGGSGVLAAAGPLKSRTPYTITDGQALVDELHDVHRTAIAYDRQEASVGLFCVAAPVLSRDGTARASLSISLPAEHRRSVPEIAASVRMAALALSRESQDRI